MRSLKFLYEMPKETFKRNAESYIEMSKEQLANLLILRDMQKNEIGIKYSVQDNDLLDIHDYLLYMSKKYGRIAFEEQIKLAVDRKELNRKKADLVYKKLDKIRKSRLFRAVVKELRAEYPNSYCRSKFYPEFPTENKLKSWIDRSLELTQSNPKNMLTDVNDALHYFAIDAIVGDQPYIHRFDVTIDFQHTPELLGRMIVVIRIPISHNIAEFRQSAEKAFGSFVTTYVKRRSSKYRADWGAKSHLRDELAARNRKIRERYDELKKEGFTDRAAYAKIQNEMNLPMDAYSIRPIIKSHKSKSSEK